MRNLHKGHLRALQEFLKHPKAQIIIDTNNLNIDRAMVGTEYTSISDQGWSKFMMM